MGILTKNNPRTLGIGNLDQKMTPKRLELGNGIPSPPLDTRSSTERRRDNTDIGDEIAGDSSSGEEYANIDEEGEDDVFLYL